MILNPDNTSLAFRQRWDLVELVVLPHLSISEAPTSVFESFAVRVPLLVNLVGNSVVQAYPDRVPVSYAG